MAKVKEKTAIAPKKKERTAKPAAGATIAVGLGSCGIAAGAQGVLEALTNELKKRNLTVKLKQVGCMGLCFREVLVEVQGIPPGRKILYGNVTPDMIERIIEQHVIEGKPVKEWIVIDSGRKTADSDFLTKQQRIVLRNCGAIDPEEIDEYIAGGGYKAMKKALESMTPEAVIEEVKTSGLRGRGGAGFSTGQKWEFARRASGEQKYVICNADEGDPGAFMDRAVLEGDPHSVIEGMIIAAYAIGCSEGYIYARAEYPLAIRRLKIAIEQAKKHGFLGKSILGTPFSLNIKLKQGAGAFVCGEETALMASIEGERGMPRMRPPYPANSGLWGKPTNINNVETFANISWIIVNGGKKYSSIGTETSKGTKVFALTGKVKRSGLVEVPMGTTIREIIFDIGGGILNDGEFKAVQMGGPTGGCLPLDLLDTPIDYESLMKTGAVVGSGGLVVADSSTCMVDLARYFLNFAQSESCGKCVPCRLGTRAMLDLLTRITRGQGSEEDVELLKSLARDVKAASLCALGGTAPNPVLTTLRYFQDEYEMHVRERRCAAGVCEDLTLIAIKDNLCQGCGICIRYCPVEAISGERKAVHSIDMDKCLKCGVCLDNCPFDAIYRK
jgi:NADH-quinone oxidoreductase subunit F